MGKGTELLKEKGRDSKAGKQSAGQQEALGHARSAGPRESVNKQSPWLPSLRSCSQLTTAPLPREWETPGWPETLRNQGCGSTPGVPVPNGSERKPAHPLAQMHNTAAEVITVRVFQLGIC